MTSSATSDVAAKGSPPAAGFRLPRAARIRRARDIRATMRSGRRKTGHLVDVFWTSSPSGRPRVAIIVPRHGRSAVARNRVRRRLFEIVRTGWMPTLNQERMALDVVFRAKPAAYEASYDRLREALKERMEAVCAP